jgi:predicted DCC family thiol-disulfide oxidoreductase YuxK
MPILATLAYVVRRTLDALGNIWSQIWFQPMSTVPLEVIRIGVGSLVFLHYAMASPYLFMFWGNTDWMPLEAAMPHVSQPWAQSLLFYFTESWQWIAFHALFLFSTAAFALGWRTSIVKWIVLIGHLSYDHRNLTISYGVQSITACLLFIMCMAPVGRAVSLDRVRAVRAAKRRNPEATLAPYISPWAGACTRLIQIQMVTLWFFSSIGKIRGDDWWNGDAVWYALTTYEFYNPVAMAIAAPNYWLINIATYGTILLELVYPFLVWQKSTRPLMLICAMFLHLMFFVLLGLVYFSAIMMLGHLSFLHPDWLASAREAWKRRMGDMEMVYDGRCGFCVRSMAWLLAFDGLGQIRIRDFRANPSPIVSDAQLEKALYVVLPDGRALAGFEACRHVVPRVPGLWWLAPLFNTPVLNRLLGQPIYNWIARNRAQISDRPDDANPGNLDSAARA